MHAAIVTGVRIMSALCFLVKERSVFVKVSIIVSRAPIFDCVCEVLEIDLMYVFQMKVHYVKLLPSSAYFPQFCLPVHRNKNRFTG